MTANGMKLFVGCVENRDDPLHLGRCQCRIIGLHTEDKTSLPTDDLPWAYPIQPITSAGVSGVGTAPIGPVPGTWILISFLDPDNQQPLMVGVIGGSGQTASDLASGQIVYNKVDADGSVVDAVPIQGSGATVPAPATAGSSGGGAVADGEQQATLQKGEVVTNKDSIIGPLAKLIAKAESGAAGYNAFNRGTSSGKIVGSGGNLNLVSMPIKEIMAKQSLPPGSPDRLFAVGKYQCIPVTLSAACNSLGIDTSCSFNETIQDRICQEYLVGKKRPPLIAYYNNPDKMSESLLVKAGKSLAAEFASIEDPEYPGYPYGGPDGKYYKGGNKVGTKWALIKSTLLQEWDFRNGKGVSTSTSTTDPTATSSAKPSIPPTIAATNDKPAKGTDYFGVSKITPADDSVKSIPKEKQSETTGFDSVTESFNINQFTSSIPGINSIGGISGLANLGISTDMLSSLSGDIINGIVSQAAAFKELVSSIDLGGSISQLTSGVGSVLSEFGDSISEISGNLGLTNITGSLSELTNELGLVNPSKDSIVAELERIAGTPQGQARSMLAKLEAEGEPTGPKAMPVGSINPDGSISTGNAVDPLKGFQDPNGQYPKYKSEPDTNRLATGNNVGRTYVLKKEAARRTNIPVANGGTWDQSPVPYNAKYPYNKVTQSESGHVMEIDDTPGSERIHWWHKSGSFFEWDANGTQVNQIVGDGYTIYERNGNIYIKGGCNVTVDGALNVRTDNIMNLEVSGAMQVNIYNNAEINVSGDCDLSVGAELNAKAAKINLESTGQFNIKAGTGLNIQSGSDTNFKVGGDFILGTDSDVSVKTTGSIFLESTINTNLKATGKINTQSKGETNIKSSDKINIQSTGEMNVKSAAAAKFNANGKLSVKANGALAMDGAIVDIQNGSSDTAGSAGDSKAALTVKSAGQADIELPIETRGTSGVFALPPLAVTTRASEVAYDSPDAAGGAAIAQFQAKQIANGSYSKTDITTATAVNGQNTPNATSGASPGPVAGLDQIKAMSPDQFTAGMKLSKHFTLGDLTAGGTRIPRQTYTLGDGSQITAQEIVCNLKTLAETALDPIRDQLGPFTITSCFRRPGDLKQKEGGDHPRGCAADIVFPGGKTATYDAAGKIVKIIPCWNQVIMEYNGGTQYWVHVAVKPANNKGEMFTMNCHSKIASTYPKGGFVLV